MISGILFRKQYVFDPFVPKPAAFPEGELREVSGTIPSKIVYFRSLRAETGSIPQRGIARGFRHDSSI